jgi:hypothetical protein
MGIEAIVATVLLIAGSVGGYFGGKRSAVSQSMGIAVDTVELLQVQVATLIEQGRAKDEKIATLEGRVNVLNDLVTQRAEVEAVHTEVMEVKEIVDRIAAKVGA